MKNLGLFGGIALSLLGLAVPASASVLSISVVSPFSTLDLSSIGPNTPNSFISGAPGSIGGVTYSFAGGATSPSGIYAGSVGGVAVSPYADATTKYFSAESGGSVTLNFASTRELDVLWGTVDSGSTRNLLTTSAGSVNGSQILALCGSCVDGKTNTYVKIFFDSAISSATFSDAVGQPNAFEFNVAAVPELSTWGMMILGFFGLGFFGYRKSKSEKTAFRVA